VADREVAETASRRGQVGIPAPHDDRLIGQVLDRDPAAPGQAVRWRDAEQHLLAEQLGRFERASRYSSPRSQSAACSRCRRERIPAMLK